jgi:hypothetical protein
MISASPAVKAVGKVAKNIVNKRMLRKPNLAAFYSMFHTRRLPALRGDNHEFFDDFGQTSEQEIGEFY